MKEGRPPSNWFLMLLYGYYRLFGASKTQAQWRVQQFIERPRKAAQTIEFARERIVEHRFHCVCGQLLTRGTKRCGRCNRRQFLPYPLRVLSRTFVRMAPGGRPATACILVVLALGYFCQLRMDDDTSLGGFPWSLYALGAAFPDLTLGGQLWRSVAYSWLHGGVWHIVMNAIVLIQIAPLTEDVYGSARVFLAWWLSAIGGAVLPFLIFEMHAPVIGASGANFGLMGMTMVFGHRLGTTEGKKLRDTMILWAALSTVFGFMGGMNIAHGAHFSGLFVGILLSVVLPSPNTPEKKRLTAPIAMLGVVIFLSSVAASVSWLSSPMKPPETMPAIAQARYLYSIAQVRGDALVLGAEGAEFLDRVRTFSKSRNARQEQRLVREKDRLVMGMSEAERMVFDYRLAEILGISP